MSSISLDSNFWNNKYINKTDRWDLGKITPFFIGLEKEIQRESNLLIPGCGRGYDALYFASKMHNVHAVDFSSFATNFLSTAALKNKINIKISTEDFFKLSKKYEKYYDYIIEYTFFCAIVPSMRRAYAEKCYSLLRDHGALLGLFLPLNDQKDVNIPPFQVTVDDIYTVFEDLFKIEIIKTNIKSIPPRKNNEIFVKLIKQ